MRAAGIGLLLAMVALSRTALADDRARADFEALLGRLEHPPRPGTVRDLVRHPFVANAEPARRLAATLGEVGGYASTRGLFALASHRDPTVRLAALEAASVSGLRVREGMDHVREALRDRARGVRLAAFAAVGRVGDSHDVPSLLDALASTDPADLAAAHAALQALTGLRMSPQIARWEYWWTETQDSLGKRVDAAVATVEEARPESDVAGARESLARYAWFEADRLREALRAWLRSSDPRMRIEGYRLAAAARYGDLAEEVGSAFRYDRDLAAFEAGRESARALGFPTEGVIPPKPPLVPGGR